MKRILAISGMFVLVAAIFLAGVAVAGFTNFNLANLRTSNAEQAAPLAEAVQQAPPQADTNPEQIIVDGKVTPAKNATLSLVASGVVAQVFVKEGQLVSAGDVLIQLDASDIQVTAAQAQADLMRAEAQLEELRNGALPATLAVVTATLDAAQARLDRIRNAAEAGDLAAVEASVSVAQAGLQKVLEGSSEAQLIEARAGLANAQAELSRAQSAYNAVKWRNDIGALPESASLQTATNNFEAAQARLEDLRQGASQADIANANAEVRRAQAQRDALVAVLPSDIAIAEADLRSAQASYDLLAAGTRAEQIKVAEANLAAATAAYQRQLIALGKTKLIAPFAGTVASLDISEGEQVTAGAPILRLADFSAWQIETADLTELQVVNIAQDQRAILTFDAIPELELTGKVQRIRPFGEDSLGDIVYRVIVTPSQQDKRLLWNMTAAVAFE